MECQRSLFASDGTDKSIVRAGSDLAALLPAVSEALRCCEDEGDNDAPSVGVDPSLIRSLWLAVVLFGFHDVSVWGLDPPNTLTVIAAACPPLVTLSSTGTRGVPMCCASVDVTFVFSYLWCGSQQRLECFGRGCLVCLIRESGDF
jgi:hypothetical protein